MFLRFVDTSSDFAASASILPHKTNSVIVFNNLIQEMCLANRGKLDLHGLSSRPTNMAIVCLSLY
ncbi:hypothetical protein [Sporolactobacillus sp. KGMB 08714]|uniref:hypothetical protein n=1 Tax=Sporolactobacillus sp. KGMB 08714 TaxID=3064704 RepID=UPI002FBDCB8D